MGFAADRLINAQYQISGTVIGKLDPVKHHDAIHRVELRQRIERRHAAGSTAALRQFASSSTAGILASRHNVPRELMHALVVFGSGYSGDGSNESRIIVPRTGPEAVFR